MTPTGTPSYRFRTQKQWASGVLSRALVGKDGGIAPLQPFARSARSYPSSGARAPAFDKAGDLYWLDDSGTLLRLNAAHAGTEDEIPHRLPVPRDIAESPRVVTGRAYLWVVGCTRRAVLQYDLASLQPIQSVELDGDVLDLSDDRRDGVWALVRRGEQYALLQIDCAGYKARTVLVPATLCAPAALAYLKGASAIALLACDGRALAFVNTDGVQRGETLWLDALTACFSATLLSGDGLDRIVLAGPDHWKPGQHLLFVLDGNGETLDHQALSTEIRGVALNSAGLAVTSTAGVGVYDAVPDERGTEASCVFITPTLYSPESSDERGWLRAEILAAMSQGASLTVEYASTNDTRLAEQVTSVLTNQSLPPNLRQSKISLLLDGEWSEPALLLGSDDTQQSDEQRPYAAPLFAAPGSYLWLRLTLTAAAGALMPYLSELRVLYPDRSLLKNLPPIYATSEKAPDFTRRLLGVLETTTQGLDTTIGSLGSLIHPDTAPQEWLDVVARWLGVPWDDELDVTRKRALLHAAPQILGARGTRASLELLLETLFPDSPRRFVVLDYTAEHDVPRLGGGNCCGARLPLLICGLPATNVTLGRRVVLGKARLCPTSPCADPLERLTGRIDVAVTATQSERGAYEPWLESLLRAVLPITCRLVLRWRAPRPAGWSTVLDNDLELGATPVTNLGETALLGHTRFPANRPPTLTQDGPDLGLASMS